MYTVPTAQCVFSESFLVYNMFPELCITNDLLATEIKILVSRKM